MEKLYPIIVQCSFMGFLLTFLYVTLRWFLADAKYRGKRGWPIAGLMVGIPILSVVARMAFRGLIPKGVSMGLMFGVPVIVWLVWLIFRPRVEHKSTDAVLIGRESSLSYWLLATNLLAAGYGVATVWLAQWVVYPSFLDVPPVAFTHYFENYNINIVFPVIVALSVSWALAALLILHHPKSIPSWAPWTSAGLALLGFAASMVGEFPFNEILASQGFSAEAIHAKIDYNWFRLIAWTLQAGFLTWMTKRCLSTCSKGEE